jgi:hypothetical protein
MFFEYLLTSCRPNYELLLGLSTLWFPDLRSLVLGSMVPNSLISVACCCSLCSSVPCWSQELGPNVEAEGTDREPIVRPNFGGTG